MVIDAQRARRGRLRSHPFLELFLFRPFNQHWSMSALFYNPIPTNGMMVPADFHIFHEVAQPPISGCLFMFIQYFGFLLITVPPHVDACHSDILGPLALSCFILIFDISGSLWCFVVSPLWGWLAQTPPTTNNSSSSNNRFPSRSSLHGMDGCLAAGNSRGRLVEVYR